VSVSLALTPTFTVAGVIVAVEVPVRPATVVMVVMVAVRVPPLPPKATLLFGKSLVSEGRADEQNLAVFEK
jgi:hypothetical protein